MFIKPTEFKKLAKSAWETGTLVLSMYEGQMLIEGSSWVIAYQVDTIPNRIKAILVEMCGELPGVNETFRACKGQANQYEFEQTVLWGWIEETVNSARYEAEVTRAAWIKKSGRMSRVVKAGTTTMMVAQEVLNTVDKSAIEEWEDDMRGPFLFRNQGLYWENSYGTAIFLRSDTVDDRDEIEYLNMLNGLEVADQ